MAGIYGSLLKKNNYKQLYKLFYNYKFPNTVQEENYYQNFLFGKSVLNKFNDNRYSYENDSFIVYFEGINYSKIKTPKQLIQAYQKEKQSFVKQLKGTFSGFLFSKEEQKLFVFTDPLATKSIYYFQDQEHGFAFSSEMHVLSKLLRKNNINIQYDYDGVYSLAAYGQMFNNFTIVKEIKHLNNGEVLEFDVINNTITINKYFRFKKDEKDQKLDDIVENIDALMLKAVKEEWEKDVEHNYSAHLGFLSGGMDSRINMLLAKELGFNKINAYTYGNPHSSDVKIAQQIAKDHFYAHSQYNLLNGNFFIENILNNYVKATDGLTHFTANAIIYNAMHRINTNVYGLVHSGQLGDTVSGSFLKTNFNFVENKDKIGLTGYVNEKSILNKLSFLDELIKRYQHTDYELFAYQQRQVNGTLMGDKVFNNFIDLASPFYNIDVLNYMLTIPNKFKINQQIYFNWLQKKHPAILNYKWEKIGLKPNKKFNIKTGRLFKKYFNGGKKYFKLKYDSMNPITNWFQENPSIKLQFDKLFKDNLEKVKDKQLQNDLQKIYDKDIFEYRNKFAALTVVLSIKLHFTE